MTTTDQDDARTIRVVTLLEALFRAERMTPADAATMWAHAGPLGVTWDVDEPPYIDRPGVREGMPSTSIDSSGQPVPSLGDIVDSVGVLPERHGGRVVSVNYNRAYDDRVQGVAVDWPAEDGLPPWSGAVVLDLREVRVVARPKGTSTGGACAVVDPDIWGTAQERDAMHADLGLPVERCDCGHLVVDHSNAWCHACNTTCLRSRRGRVQFVTAVGDQTSERSS